MEKTLSLSSLTHSELLDPQCISALSTGKSYQMCISIEHREKLPNVYLSIEHREKLPNVQHGHAQH